MTNNCILIFILNHYVSIYRGISACFIFLSGAKEFVHYSKKRTNYKLYHVISFSSEKNFPVMLDDEGKVAKKTGVLAPSAADLGPL